MTPVELTPKKIRAMQAFLGEMASVLGKPEARAILYLADTGQYAWTDGDAVTINLQKLSWTNPAKGWLQTKGLFYHEMMHGIADPVRSYRDLPGDTKQSLNVLSDQTGEVRFVNMYPGARDYFAMNVCDLILKGAKDTRTYALVYGRRSFLPRRLVKAARKLMQTKYTEKQVAEAECIINQYHLEASRTDDQEVFQRLADQLSALLGGAPLSHEDLQGGHMEPRSKEADHVEEPEGGPEPEGEPTEAPTEPEGDEASSEDETDSAEEKDLRKIAKAEREAAVDRELRQATKEAEELALLGDEVGEDTAKAAHELAALLRRIQVQAQAGYEAGHRSGRINIRRVLAGQGRSTDIFSQFQPDRRMATKLSIALVVDRSGSMSSRLNKVNQVVAAIAMACEESNPLMNKTMIRYFEDTDLLTKRPADKFRPHTSLCGYAGLSNHPGDSMARSLDWLRTETGVKLLIVLTDGYWDTNDCAHRCLARSLPSHDTKDQRDSLAAKARAEAEGVKIQALHMGAVTADERWKKYGLPVRAVHFDEVAQTVFGIVQEAMREQARKVLA